jgi:dTDP-3-amino-3,4,6-trideoxy-alpha-D-glucose transaminase
VGPGDEVVCPSHTFFASVEAVIHTGATPVLVDVEPDTLTLDPEAVRAALSPTTRALLPVHLYGHPANMDPLLELARERGLRVIEDAAQAHGARYRGRRCGSLGDAAAFSFYFTKNLGALGEGGFVATRDPEVAERLRLLRHHGHTSKFEHTVVGGNLRMDEVQAAVLRLRLPRLDAGNARRREIAARYGELLGGCPLRLPSARAGCEPVHHLYPVRTARRDALREHLTRDGVGTGIHYPVPAHRQPALRGRPHRCTSQKVTEEACAELLSLPIYPELREEQLELVAHSVRGFFAAAGEATG